MADRRSISRRGVLAALLMALIGGCGLTQPKPRSIPKDAQESVQVYLKLSDDGFGSDSEHDAIYALQDDLTNRVKNSRVGELDGDEWGDGFCTVYLYGPNADPLFDVIRPSLAAFKKLPGSYVVKRYGKPGSKEKRLQLN